MHGTYIKIKKTFYLFYVIYNLAGIIRDTKTYVLLTD